MACPLTGRRSYSSPLIDPESRHLLFPRDYLYYFSFESTRLFVWIFREPRPDDEAMLDLYSTWAGWRGLRTRALIEFPPLKPERDLRLTSTGSRLRSFSRQLLTDETSNICPTSSRIPSCSFNPVDRKYCIILRFSILESVCSIVPAKTILYY